MLKISVITATYNSGKTVADTLRSVAGQTYENVEHLVIDGASSDDTLSIVEAHRSNYPKTMEMRVDSRRDKGIYDAMNRGISLATGDIVGILNSDDFYSSNEVLARVAEAFAADPDLEAVYGDVHYVNPANTAKAIRRFSSAKFTPKRMLRGYMPAHPSFYCRREVYERFGNFDITYPIGADFENLVRLIYLGQIRTKYLPFDFVTMRTGGASASKLQILKDQHRALRQHGLPASWLRLASRYPSRIIEYIKK